MLVGNASSSHSQPSFRFLPQARVPALAQSWLKAHASTRLTKTLTATLWARATTGRAVCTLSNCSASRMASTAPKYGLARFPNRGYDRRPLHSGVSMVAVSALWLPILVSAVAVFVVSSIIHMTPLWHKSDYPRLPTEDRVLD